MSLTLKLNTKALSVFALLAVTPVAFADKVPPKIDTLVQESATRVMRQYNVPGMVIAISDHGAQRFYNFGVASKETQTPATPDTLFEIGSISKVFTATLATYAQAKGHLSLKDPVAEYVPELKGTPFGQIHLVHLATHTAGGFPLQVPEHIQNSQQFMDYLKVWKPAYTAGSQRTYANPSIGMLGVIAAKSMGTSYREALEKHLFAEAGLKNSYLNVPANKAGLYAQGYNKEDAPVRLSAGVLADEAYGVKTTARDLIHFMELNMGLGQASQSIRRAVADTHTGYFQIGPVTQDLIWEQYPYPTSLKVLLRGNANSMAYESHTATALNPPLPPQKSVWVNKTGSTNGFGGYVVFIPERQQAVVILANKNYPNDARVTLAHTLIEALD